jgi:hypothetical protein
LFKGGGDAINELLELRVGSASKLVVSGDEILKAVSQVKHVFLDGRRRIALLKIHQKLGCIYP